MIRASIVAYACTALSLLSPLATRAMGQTPHAFESLKLDDKKSMRFVLSLPDKFDKAKEYPVLIALPGGVQDEPMVEESLEKYWEAEAKKRGWVLVSPAAADEATALRPNLSPLIDEIAKRVTVEGGKVHLAGVSNGGFAAFNYAIREPERVASLTTLPGFPQSASDMNKMFRLKDVPVTLYVGDKDERWLEESRKAEDRLKKAGGSVTLNVLKGQGLSLTIGPKELFDMLETRRPKPVIPPPAETPEQIAVREAIAASLDDFHDAAAKADFDRYFSHFADNGVFLGTDATERWNVEEFKKYCEPNFRIGKGWTYTPVDRHITMSTRGDMAWFDELLENSKYGLCRGSGVLIKVTVAAPKPDGAPTGVDPAAPKPKAVVAWKVLQYNLAFAVPNDTAEQVVRITKPKQKKPGEK